ncbi:VOC family protein [Cellulomonas aerilata]|uniref:Glyoxalase n=1 Tax=Cellulomonas aerilata TaxID=515326 RepID=A0A512D9U3_9CELL|nr:VOC family protein [Cellulomonas aerilata]GEO33239.1 glyoxalase [Cellulomonas aerilata]
MSARVVHFELPYDDGERAQKFYSEAFGWSLMPMPEMEYTVVTTGPVTQDGRPTEPGYVNGGLLPRPAAAPGTVVVVDVDDIDATLVAVERAGGSTVAGRRAVGDMGFTAYVEDSEGNVVGLWQTAAG